MLTFISLCVIIIGAGYIVSKLPGGCSRDCNQGRNCDCGGK